MNLRELIELLQALQPPAALDAGVIVTDGKTDVDINAVSYVDGEVRIEVDPMPVDRYDEGYEEGIERGREEAEDDD